MKTNEDLSVLVNKFLSFNSQIDELDSEPDSPRKDRTISEITELRAVVMGQLKDEYLALVYPSVPDDVEFYNWLSTKSAEMYHAGL